MAQQKPSIHNRDHSHGGADVVLIDWEDTDGAAPGDPDPFPQYQLESEKNQPSGYAGLDGGGKVAAALLGSVDRLSDVDTTTSAPTSGQSLVWDSGTSQWKPGSAAGALPADTVVVAGTRIIANKLLSGDANAAFRFLGDGKHEWGPGGGSALDTNLYRLGSGSLKTDGDITALRGFWVTRSAAGNVAFQANVSGDSADRLDVFADGKHEWGPGNAARDTTLYRYGVGSLKTDGTFRVGNFLAIEDQSVAATAIGVTASGDVANRFLMDNTGKITWGPGSSAGDTNLYRGGANQLVSDDQIWSAGGSGGFVAYNGAYFNLIQTGSTASAFLASASGDSTARLAIRTDGRFDWGPGNAAADAALYRSAAGFLKTDTHLSAGQSIRANDGASNQILLGTDGHINFGSAQDTTIYRNAADTLKSDDGFIAAGAIATKTKGGIPTDSDVVAGMAVDGTIMVDTSNNRLYVRYGGAWKYAALT